MKKIISLFIIITFIFTQLAFAAQAGINRSFMRGEQPTQAARAVGDEMVKAMEAQQSKARAGGNPAIERGIQMYEDAVQKLLALAGRLDTLPESTQRIVTGLLDFRRRLDPENAMNRYRSIAGEYGAGRYSNEDPATVFNSGMWYDIFANDLSFFIYYVGVLENQELGEQDQVMFTAVVECLFTLDYLRRQYQSIGGVSAPAAVLSANRAVIISDAASMNTVPEIGADLILNKGYMPTDVKSMIVSDEVLAGDVHAMDDLMRSIEVLGAQLVVYNIGTAQAELLLRLQSAAAVVNPAELSGMTREELNQRVQARAVGVSL